MAVQPDRIRHLTDHRDWHGNRDLPPWLLHHRKALSVSIAPNTTWSQT